MTAEQLLQELTEVCAYPLTLQELNEGNNPSGTEEHFIPHSRLMRFIFEIRNVLRQEKAEEERKANEKPYKKLLFVEDGSLLEDTAKIIEERNPEIKVVVYKAGVRPPQLTEIKGE